MASKKPLKEEETISKSSPASDLLKNEQNLYVFDEKYNDSYFKSHPWRADDLHFKKVFISSLAAMKIVDHAIRGGNKEICGYLMGFARDGIFYVLDAFEMPIIGTGARVEVAGQMGEKAQEASAEYMELMSKLGREHPYIGWYHSHPGFGCWLSGIDVTTERQLEMGYQTFFALVVDPYRTKSNKKIEFGCFRCYQKEETNRLQQTFDSIPLKRAEEFGIHQSKYYRIPHEFFQSNFESQIIKLIYKNYWMETLCANALLVNDEFYKEKLNDVKSNLEAYNLEKKSRELKNKNHIEIHQKKIDDISNLNTLMTVNYQNELVKGLIFKDK